MSFNELLAAFGFTAAGGVWRKGGHAVATVAGGWGMWKHTSPAGIVTTGIDKESLAMHLRAVCR